MEGSHMFGSNDVGKQADRLLAMLSASQGDRAAAQKAANDLLRAGKGASTLERDSVISRFAAAMPSMRLGRAALLAIASGALVEQGADYRAIAEPVFARFAEAVQGGLPFAEACLAEASSGIAPEGAADGAPSAEEAIEKVGQRVSERMPEAAQAFAALEWLVSAALAMLCRSRPLRQRLRTDGALVQAIERYDALGAPLPCFREMVAVLDDEQVVVLHPALARGYIIRIAGIGHNFQLHTLLADALIGEVEQGWLPGERPSPEVAALAKDRPFSVDGDTPTAYGAFNLWNWMGLLADGTLPEGQSSGSEHWIWNEGVPADIVPFQGTRVILIGPTPYPRTWNSGRFFPAMVGEMEVLRQLNADEARGWLDPLARAPKPGVAGRYVTASDVEAIE
jgi:hypothetical protein